ncbi:hypothetical protein ABH926_008447 [Catenulispora sp. GP43]|uniref:baeRF2 domain-containing protein n=1 Tax=Catenulispora sp. GP43 TaxID=3156263 RepID=UPI0035190A71
MPDTITDNPLVHDLYHLPAPVLTAYLNPPSSRPGVDDTDLRLRSLVADLRSAGASSDALEALASVLGTLEPGRPPAAAFVGTDGQTRMFPLPGAEVGDQAYCAAVPRVLPMLAWRQLHPAFATVMLDRAGAELVVQPAGGARALRAEVAGPDNVIGRDAPGGASRSRYQNRAESSWQHNAGRAAEVVADALAAAEADLLIVGGDVRAEQYFLDRLPARLRSEVTIKTIPGGRSRDGSRHRRGDEVEAVVQEYVDEEALRTLSRVQDRSGPGGLGVQGPAATIHALARAQVEVLLLAQAGLGQGSMAEAGAGADPGTAWFGPRPTDISEHRTGVLVPGGKPSHARLDEVLARAAVLTDADIRILPPGLPEAPPHGVGALCRFAVS